MATAKGREEDGVEDMDTGKCAYSNREVVVSCTSGESAILISPSMSQQGQGVSLENRSQEPGSSAGSRKRGRESEGFLLEEGARGGEREVEKRGCEEGMSWLTCLMLGMDQENTKPRIVRKLHTPQN